MRTRKPMPTRRPVSVNSEITMAIEILNESGAECDLDALLSLAQHVILEMGLHPECDLEISLVDEARMSDLHVEWMDLPGPTDVLSFPMDELEPHSAPDGPGIIGDIVLCPQFAEQQAKTSLRDELLLLTAHGILHCIGYDHAEPEEEKVMFELQEKIVSDWKKSQ